MNPMGRPERVALVTGGTRGIGEAIARGLAANGFSVAISGHAGRTVTKAVERLGKDGVPVKGFAAVWITGASGSDINVVFIGAVATGAVPSQVGANFGTYQAVLTQ